MKFLIDQNRSPRLASLLRDHGHEREGRIIVSGDTDFGTLLAMSQRTRPSVILFRSRNLLTADQHAELILSHLDDLTPDLSEGAVVVVSDDRIRIRRLPLIHDA